MSPVSTATLEQSGGWGGTQFLIVIVVLFTLALIVGPAIAWRQFNRTEAA